MMVLVTHSHPEYNSSHTSSFESEIHFLVNATTLGKLHDLSESQLPC
jgi:hypothetical protein